MTPYCESGGVTIYHGDCRDVLGQLDHGIADVCLADPPYGETSLAWDRCAENWLPRVGGALKQTGSLWCFGSLRFFMTNANEFRYWRHVQEVIWEKHNGSSFHADRFKRVHEMAVQFIHAEATWREVYKKPVYTSDATARTVRRKERPPHTGHIEASSYTSFDGGPRLMRSVFRARSCHGYAAHPTQKPEEVVAPLVEYACPPGGLVLSPFMGSGTDLRVALNLGLRAIGIEIEERYCEIAARRLEQQTLFAPEPVTATASTQASLFEEVAG